MGPPLPEFVAVPMPKFSPYRAAPIYVFFSWFLGGTGSMSLGSIPVQGNGIFVGFWRLDDGVVHCLRLLLLLLMGWMDAWTVPSAVCEKGGIWAPCCVYCELNPFVLPSGSL